MSFNCSPDDEKSNTLTFQDYLYLAIDEVVIPVLVTLSIYSGWLEYTKTSALEVGVIKPLEKAAQASSIKVAQQELQKAIGYVNSTPRLHSYVNGSDPSWQGWFNNLEGQLENLQTIDSNASRVEKTLVLLQTNRVLLQDLKVNIPQDAEAENDNTNCILFGLISLAFLFLLFRYTDKKGFSPEDYLRLKLTHLFRNKF